MRSSDPEFEEETKVDFIPRSIRINNPVCCSDNVKEDQQIDVVIKQSNNQHKMYNAKQAKDTKEVSRIKITI